MCTTFFFFFFWDLPAKLVRTHFDSGDRELTPARGFLGDVWTFPARLTVFLFPSAAAGAPVATDARAPHALLALRQKYEMIQLKGEISLF